GLAADDLPLPLVPGAEVVEAARAHDVDRDTVDLGPLVDCHLGLRDRPVTGHVGRVTTEEVQDADASFEPPAAGRDEVPRGPLEPGGGQPARGGMPHRGDPFPAPGVTPQRPVLHKLTEGEPVRIGCRLHGGSLGGRGRDLWPYSMPGGRSLPASGAAPRARPAPGIIWRWCRSATISA